MADPSGASNISNASSYKLGSRRVYVWYGGIYLSPSIQIYVICMVEWAPYVWNRIATQ